MSKTVFDMGRITFGTPRLLTASPFPYIRQFLCPRCFRHWSGVKELKYCHECACDLAEKAEAK